MDETYNCCSCIVHVLIINSVPNMNIFGNLSYFSFSSKEIYTKTCFTFRSKTKGRVSETNLASIIPKDAKLISAKALVVFFKPRLENLLQSHDVCKPHFEALPWFFWWSDWKINWNFDTIKSLFKKSWSLEVALDIFTLDWCPVWSLISLWTLFACCNNPLYTLKCTFARKKV